MSISHSTQLNISTLTMISLYRNIDSHISTIARDLAIIQKTHNDEVLNERFRDCELQSNALKETLETMRDRAIELIAIHKQKEEKQK